MQEELEKEEREGKDLNTIYPAITAENVQEHPLVKQQLEEYTQKLKESNKSAVIEIAPANYLGSGIKINKQVPPLTSYEFKDTDRIYILPNVKLIDRNVFNNLIKEKKVKGKRVHKIEEATVIIGTPYTMFSSSSNYLYLIDPKYPERTRLGLGQTGRWDVFDILNHNFKLKQLYPAVDAYNFTSVIPEDKLKEYLAMTILTEVITIRSDYVGIQADWYGKYIYNPDIPFVSEAVVLKICFEETNKLKEDSGEYNIDALLDLLMTENETNVTLAITMMKSINLVPEFFKILSILSRYKYNGICRSLLYDFLIKKNPTLSTYIGGRNFSLHYSDTSRILNMMEYLNANFGTKLSIKDFIWYIDYHKVNISPSSTWTWSDIANAEAVAKLLGVEITREELLEKVFLRNNKLTKKPNTLK